MKYQHRVTKAEVLQWMGLNIMEIEDLVGRENVLLQPYDNFNPGNDKELGRLFILIDENFIRVKLNSFILVDERNNISIFKTKEELELDYETK